LGEDQHLDFNSQTARIKIAAASLWLSVTVKVRKNIIRE